MGGEYVGIFRLATEQLIGRVDVVTRCDAFILVELEDNVWRGSVGKRRTLSASQAKAGPRQQRGRSSVREPMARKRTSSPMCGALRAWKGRGRLG